MHEQSLSINCNRVAARKEDLDVIKTKHKWKYRGPSCLHPGGDERGSKRGTVCMTRKSGVAPTKSIPNAANNQAAIWTIGSKRNANSKASWYCARRRGSKEIRDVGGQRTKATLGYRAARPIMPRFLTNCCSRPLSRKGLYEFYETESRITH
jgi:hypothetical protein